MPVKNIKTNREFIIGEYELLACVVLILSFLPNVSEATNGYFAHGYGSRSKAMAGTGAALPQDAMAAAINPAGMVFVGDRLDVEGELFSPHRKYTVQGTPTFTPGSFPLNQGTVKSDSEYFFVPTIGFNYKIDNEQSIGLTLFGNGGMNTDYPNFASQTCPPGGSGTFCAGRTGIDLMQAFISPSYAHSFLDGRFSLGIAPIFAIQTFKARGLESFSGFSSQPGSVSGQGRDYSFGAGVRVGALAEVLPGLRLGVSYKSQIFMTPFNNYAGLFAEQGSFDIPESINGGVAWDISDNFTAAFDVEHIRYSSVKSVGNSFLPNLMVTQLGTNQAAGFGWKDMTVFKFGAQWKPDKDWIVRAGFSYGEQPIPKSEVLFNILAPGVQEWHLTTGFSHALTKEDDVSFAFMYSPSKTVSGINPLSPSQTIELEMNQFSFQLGWTRRF